jgi:hypothetical protein
MCCRKEHAGNTVHGSLLFFFYMGGFHQRREEGRGEGNRTGK